MSPYAESNLWVDPLANTGGYGVLLSDQIQFYVDAVELIKPFRKECLRPASYDLHIGDLYYRDDIKNEVGTNGLEIPPNGLVYVKIEEWFNVPYYLIARYSLRVTQVYRGLLVDNGLQIDPGYHGHIWVPIHNLTDGKRILKPGERLLCIDFARTTGFPEAPSITSEKQLIENSPV